MANYTDLMLDLETFALGTRPAIAQIGAVVFDMDPGVEPVMFKCNIALQSSILCGGKIDLETVGWWLSQGEDAKGSIARAGEYRSLALGLSDFSTFFHQHPSLKRVWSHGAATDIPWLAAAYEAAGLTPPWGYRMPRDTRTLYDLALLSEWKMPLWEGGVEHDALDDALHQAWCVKSAWNYMEAER